MINRKYEENQESLLAEFRRGLELGEVDKDKIDFVMALLRNYVARRNKRGIRFFAPKKKSAAAPQNGAAQ